MYVIDKTIEPASTVQHQIDVTAKFKIARVVVEGGQGLVVLKVSTTDKDLWARPIELSKIAGPLNLFRPWVSAGLLTFTLNNPTKSSVRFKITIT